jgi:hypothetical protein
MLNTGFKEKEQWFDNDEQRQHAAKNNVALVAFG